MAYAATTSPPSTAERAPRRLSYLDGWRGASILAVLTGHFLLGGASYLSLGPFGVELFFVLSGRLMAEILFIENTPLPTFFWRRFTRVYPGLLAFVLAMVVANAVLGWAAQFDASLILAALTFTDNYAAAFGHHTGALDHVWSLCVEEHAYLLLGAVAALTRGRALPALPIITTLAAASVVDGIVSIVLLGQEWFAVYWRTDAHVSSIMASAAAHLVLRSGTTRRLGRFTGRIAPVSFALAVVLMSRDFPVWVSYSVGPLLLAVCINTVDDLPAAARTALSWAPLRAFGVASFSIYLWQKPIHVFALGRGFPICVAGLAIAVALGSLAFATVEQPLRRHLNRWWTRRTHVAKAGVLERREASLRL